MPRRGQAMVETVIAVLVVTSIFLVLFRLSHMLTGKILLEHAAMRVARARAVGLNDFMCEKSARAAVIPVAGKRLWPEGEDFDWSMELSRVPIYMATPDGAVARGVLEYEGWNRLSVVPGDGTASEVSMRTDWFRLGGKASVGRDYSLYMGEGGR